MKFKNVTLKDGSEITLWLNESTDEWTLDKSLAEQFASNFQRYVIDNEDDSVCTFNQRSSILKYYNESSDLNKEKIRSMINEDIRKIELVYNIILESLINKRRI